MKHSPRPEQKSLGARRRTVAGLPKLVDDEVVVTLMQIVASLIVEVDLAHAELAKLKGVKPPRSHREWVRMLTGS